MLVAKVESASASVDDDSSADDDSSSVVEGADVVLVDEVVSSLLDELGVFVIVELVLELPPSSGMQFSDQARVTILLAPTERHIPR